MTGAAFAYEVQIDPITRTLIGEPRLLAKIAISGSLSRLAAAQHIIELIDRKLAP